MSLAETERLILRQIVPDDLDAFAALCADPLAMQYMGDGETLERGDVERWIGICQQKYQSPGFGTSAIVKKATNRFIGFCGVVRAPDNDFYEIVYALAADTWGKGYATEAARAMVDYVFGHFDVTDDIYATIYAQNAPSRRIMEKIGFDFLREEPDEDGITAWYVIHRPES